MSGSINLEFHLYGALRHHGIVQLDVPKGENIEGIKLRLQKHLDDDLIESCALADDNALLANEKIITANMTLAVLPPVCGG